MAALVELGYEIIQNEMMLSAAKPARVMAEASQELGIHAMADKNQRLMTYVNNSDPGIANTHVNLPGYAIKKGLRVITLIDQQRVAYNNIIQ